MSAAGRRIGKAVIFAAPVLLQALMTESAYRGWTKVGHRIAWWLPPGIAGPIFVISLIGALTLLFQTLRWRLPFRLGAVLVAACLYLILGFLVTIQVAAMNGDFM